MSEPLKVSVARALGCTPEAMNHGSDGHGYNWMCRCGSRPAAHGGMDSYSPSSHLRDYEHDWAATGPLVDKYGLRVGRVTYSGGEKDGEPTGGWSAGRETYESGERGPTALIALCNLIVALDAKGRL